MGSAMAANLLKNKFRVRRACPLLQSSAAQPASLPARASVSCSPGQAAEAVRHKACSLVAVFMLTVGPLPHPLPASQVHVFDKNEAAVDKLCKLGAARAGSPAELASTPGKGRGFHF